MAELKICDSGCAVEHNPRKDYYLLNTKYLNKIVFFLYIKFFRDELCGSGKTFKRNRYCFGTFLWNMICGWGLKESWKSYIKLIKR